LLLFYVGLRNIGAYRTSAIFGLQAAFGAVGGYILLGERLSLIQVAGATLMVSCVILLAWSHGSAGAPTPAPDAAAPETAKDKPPGP
jgi:drug/metabolite transporter (DMT)-like permease